MEHASLKLLVLTCLLFAGGLLAFVRRGEDTIQRYTVERPLPRDRMLGAIIPRGEQAWFFKLSGPRGAIDLEAARFRELIQSVRFAGDAAAEPTWKLPEGWARRPGSELRFATLEIGAGESRLECSVSMLPMPGQDRADYLVANINRWREQLRLPRIGVEKLSSATEQITLGGEGETATLVDLAGELTGGGMGQKPLARGGPPQGPSPLAAANQASGQLKYDVPTGWSAGELEATRGGITVRRAAAFEVRDGQQRVEITVTSLPASALLTNINRWRGQIGLEAWTIEQYEQARQTLEFAGSPAAYVQFFGPQEAILGVIAPQGQMAWFAKLQGPSELAGRERQHFEEFIRSIRIE